MGLWFLSSPFSSSFSPFSSLSSFSYYSYHFYKTESYFVAYTGLEFTMWPRLGNLWILLLPKFPLNSQVLKFQTCVNMPNWMHSYAWRLTFNRCLHLPDKLARMPFSWAPKALSANTQSWVPVLSNIQSKYQLGTANSSGLLGFARAQSVPFAVDSLLLNSKATTELTFNKLSLSLSCSYPFWSSGKDFVNMFPSHLYLLPVAEHFVIGPSVMFPPGLTLLVGDSPLWPSKWACISNPAGIFAT